MTRQISHNQAWATKQLITLSDSLAIAANNGVTPAQATHSQDEWTSEQFIKMSNGSAQI